MAELNQPPGGQANGAEDSELSFERAYAELEKTVNALQQGQLSLDETLRLYERGSQLARYCRERLDAMQLKVSQLLSHANGTYSTKPIGGEVSGPESEVRSLEPEVQELESAGAQPRARDREKEPEDEILRSQRELFE